MTGGRLIEITHPDDPRIAEFRNIRERDLTGRDSRFIAEGTVVLRLLTGAHASGGDFAAEKVLLLKNRVAGLGDIIESFPADIPIYVADAEVLDGIVGFHLHRGVLALGRRMAEDGVGAFLDRLPKQALVLAGCGISNHDNMGSMFRNAAAFGAAAVLLDESCCDPLYRKALRVSVGSILTVPYRRQLSDVELLAALAERGFAIWSLSPRGNVDIREVPASERMALVVGTEGDGLPANILSAFGSVRIPQAPGLDSLNVATASGIALFEMAAKNGRI
ncbi:MULTISPECIES: RNA methyltransferase [unclassified Rhizobium]|jgi:tRNA G18 (ribose-2'-O)-methylase SpoU|uniref:TrmH family RNA methyltransferase n=1 Tax=unclassified Rhizobium TaxID=2613769 RepID=UPI000648B505|nr:MULTISPECIES: RNA methyltransferase [unclassified Rhizobium]MBN8949299.1 RNA methyltransferase [Rhizobium tropici]OJY75104.1 MAG: RNA methyltransferase [Rhizobium sp. 60-20]RKD70915.1 tRNA G18 (ribose-2'-O)-methylase SpoU [Rhizobium sp. WW_1]